MMLKVFICFLTLIATTCYAGQIAITDTGEEVVLNSDGTWQYKEGASKKIKIIRNENVFKKNSESSFLLKSKNNNSAFFINPKKWRFKQGDPNTSESEYEFSFKDGDLYGIAITEEVPINIENLADLALENALEVAPNAKITKREYRNVNNLDTVYQELTGTMQGIEFKFMGYYFSDNSGSTQFLAYTSSNLIQKYKVDIDNFINGLTTQ